MDIQEKRGCVEVLRKLVAEADAAVNDEKFQEALSVVLDGLVVMHGKMDAIKEKYESTVGDFWRDAKPFVRNEKKAVTREEIETMRLYQKHLILGNSLKAPGGITYGTHSLAAAVKTLHSTLNKANLEMVNSFKFSLACVDSETPNEKWHDKEKAFKDITDTLEAYKQKFKK